MQLVNSKDTGHYRVTKNFYTTPIITLSICKIYFQTFGLLITVEINDTFN